MEQNLQEAILFRNNIKNIKHVLQIVLFGSVARGEDTAASDIDIAIIHDSPDEFSFMKEINKKKSEKIQTTFISIDTLPKETEIVGALCGEGLLLYGSPITFDVKNISLQSKVIFSYSLISLPQNQKMKVNRALYGSISKVLIKQKVYKSEFKGMAQKPTVEKIQKGVLLVDRRYAPQIVGVFKHFQVQYQEIAVWTY